MAIDNTITFAKGTSAPSGSTEAVIGQPLFHYATDGSVANLYVGHDTDDGDNTWIGAPILDQDNMSSNSATSLATQQSIVAYVAAQITAEDLDVTGDSGAIDIDLNSETLTIAGGSGIDTSGSGTTITIAGEDASTSNKGVASFSSDNFAVSSGAVTIKDDGVAIAELSATGTASSSTFLRGDNTWSAPSSGAVTAINNATANELVTIGSTTTELDAESNLTYNGTMLTISDSSGSDTLLKLKSTDAGAGDAPRFKLERDSGSPATNDEIGRMIFSANQADGTMKDYAGIEAEIVDKTSDSHDGILNFEVAVNATTTTVAQVDGGGLNLASGYDYEIAGTNVLTNNTLGSGVVTSSLTAVGTIGTGVWQGTAIASSYIAGDAITGGKIADDSINSEHYVDGSIDAQHLASDSVTEAKMAANSVDSQAYVDGSIDNAHIADNAINSEHYADGSVDNVHLANDGITISTTDTSLGGTITFPTMSNVDMGGNFTIGNQSDDTCTITGHLTVGGTTTTTQTIALGVADTIIFEGATANDFETTLTVTDPTADRTITLPNVTGMVVTNGSTNIVSQAMMEDNSIDSDQYVNASIDLVHMSVNSVDSNQYVDGSIDLAHMSADSVDSAQYVDGSIDTAHIASAQITLAKMADDSVDSDQYVNGSIDNAHIADDAINSEHYYDGSIDLAHMSANSVDSDQYVNGSVDNVHLANSAVTYTAGTGLSGGGAVSLGGSATLTLDMSELTDMTQTMVGTDEFIVLDASADRRKAANEIPLSIFSNDLGFGAGDITGVTAGVGLSGGGASGGVTLTLDLSELSAVTPVVGDWLATLDSDGGNEQLTLISALDTLLSATVKTLTNKTISGGTY